MAGKLPPSEWELSSDEIKLIKKRAQLRAATKEDFLKNYRNPFNRSLPGHFVDPQNTRLYAYQQNMFRYLHSSPRILLGPGVFVVAAVTLQYLIQRQRIQYNKDCNEGKVPYALRPDFNAQII